MGRKYAIYDQEALHFVTFTVVNWVDLFIRDEYKQTIIDSLKYCQQRKGLNVHAYCIMTSHIHLILSVDRGKKLSPPLVVGLAQRSYDRSSNFRKLFEDRLYKERPL